MILPNSNAALKILLAVDGSSHSAAAASLLTHITWPVGTSAQVLAVAPERLPLVSPGPKAQRGVAKMRIGLHH